MRKGVVSVVLPIYNVESYLNRCLKSVVNQSYKNLEIILVDDGSSDNCPLICDEWAAIDNRIKVIHKKNAGLGYARNTGIENATGEYICFIDSDDYISLETIEKAYVLATKEGADIISFGYNQVKNNGTIKKTVIPCPNEYIFEGENIQKVLLPSLIGPDMSTGEVSNLWMSVCGGIYSMSLIQRINWRLVSEREIISEDVYSLLRLYKEVQKVAVIPEALYFYCDNATSLTHTYKPDRFERIKHFYKMCIKACDELEYSPKIKQQLLYPFVSYTISAMKLVLISDQTEKDKKLLVKRIIGDKDLQAALNNMPITKEKNSRKIFLLLMKHKMYTACFELLKIKTKD